MHLRPRAQARLGMGLADHIVSDDKQIVITNHSVRFLGALLWNVRTEVLEPSDLMVYQSDPDDKQYCTVRRCDVTLGGTIQGRFLEFFSDPDERQVGLTSSAGCSEGVVLKRRRNGGNRAAGRQKRAPVSRGSSMPVLAWREREGVEPTAPTAGPGPTDLKSAKPTRAHPLPGRNRHPNALGRRR